jgi:hypothetical protein
MGEESILGGLAVAPFFADPVQRRDYYAWNYYLPDIKFSLFAVGAGGAYINVIYLPFVPRHTHTFTGIAFKNTATTNTGTKIRLGIYSSAANGFPGAKLLDAGEVTLDNTAALREIAISQELTRGTLYWLAMLSDSVINMLLCNPIEAPVSGVLGLSAAMATGAASRGHSVPSEAMAYASGLPATATPGGAHYESIPLIFLKG